MRLLQRRIWARLGAGAAAAVAAASVVAISGAAHAEASGADLAVSAPGAAVVQGAGKPFAINVHNNGPATATGIKLVIDTTTLDAGNPDTSKLEILEPSPDCSADDTGRIFTCAVPDLPAGGNFNAFDYRYGDLAVMSIGDAGDAGSFTASITSDTSDPDPANNRATTKVTVIADNPEAPHGIDMVAWTSDVYAKAGGTEPIKPGQTGELMWMLFNQGTVPIKGVHYTLSLPQYLAFASQRPECTYTYKDGHNSAECDDVNAIVGLGFAYGSVKPSADPGKPFDADPLVVKLAENAPGPMALTEGLVTGYGDGECVQECAPEVSSAQRASAASQDAAVLSPTEATQVKNEVKSSVVTPDAAPTDNEAPFSAFADRNPADLSISATPVGGHVGDTVSVQLTVRNAGPANTQDTKMTFTAPAGTEVASVDAKICTATTVGKEYTCALGAVPAGASHTETVGLKIVSATVADGKAEARSGVDDPDHTNNTTAIKATVLSGSTSGPATGGSTSGPATGGTGGGLPVTGTPVGLISAFGLGIAAVGVALMVLARRRREVSLPPTD